MLRIVRLRATRGLHAAAHRVRPAPLLALWLAFGVGVPAARAQLGPNIWSMQLDGGMFSPIEASAASATAGMRYCKHYSPHLQGGLLTGWTFNRTKLEAPAGGVPGPEPQVELAQTDANLVPLMGFIQVNLTDRRRLVPFAGFGAGYEWLTLHVADLQTGLQSKATYANLAWETFAGVGLRFGSIWRLNSELYYNGGSLERKVPDPSGSVRREVVHVNGVGVRVGFDMEFD
jgi:hypothetical protein